MNKVFLIGRVTKDVELMSTSNGSQYAKFDVAIDNGKDDNGERRPAEFVTVAAWQKKAETLSVFVKKGHRIAVEGKIKTDKYQNEKGENRYRTYVLLQNFEFLESKPKDGFVPQEPNYTNNTTITTEQIDDVPLENDPFADLEAQVEDNGLPFY